MPQYFFDLRSADGRVFRDPSGIELADLASAAEEASAAARSFKTKLGRYDYTGWYFHIRGATECLIAPAFMGGETRL
jgi:hypothetical protein